MAAKSCKAFHTVKSRTVFKLFRHPVNASSNSATVTFVTIFKMCRHRVNAVLEKEIKEKVNIRERGLFHKIKQKVKNDSFLGLLSHMFHNQKKKTLNESNKSNTKIQRSFNPISYQD